MSRWHGSSCKTPDIEVDADYIPRCISCGNQFLSKQVKSTNKASSALDMPAESPRGRMNLHWPPTVPYKTLIPLPNSSEHPVRERSAEERGNGSEVQTTSLTKSSPMTDVAVSPVYSKRLASDEIRLVSLPAVDDQDAPIHLSLNDFRDDNHPEYEAVSYTWGGEEGNYVQNQPIFVGPFWDVLLQTRNCADMLRFARPWQGTRTLWVDAVCINQSDVEERNQQVAKMGFIFESCVRVMVYLGPDAAPLLPKGQFPRRRRLAELEGGVVSGLLPNDGATKDKERGQGHVFDLRSLLERQYFRRVWVIQELILAPGTVIRVGDVDYWTDSQPWISRAGEMANQSLTRDNKEGVDSLASMPWWGTRAPWVEFMGRKHFSRLGLEEVMYMTSWSQASDLRDRVFGLLDLIRPHSDTAGAGWRPDYSLPVLHVYIGLLAHCLVQTDWCHFLKFASGHDADPGSPSWMPRWSAQKDWRRLFDRPATSIASGLDARVDKVHDGPSKPASVAWLVPDSGLVRRVGSGSRQRDRACTWVKKGDIGVCSNTGAVRIDLAHLCAIPSMPRLIRESVSSSSSSSSSRIFRIDGVNGGLYITSQHALDRIVQPGRDRLFVLPHSTETVTPSIILIIRQDEDGCTPGIPRIVAPCDGVFAYAYDYAICDTSLVDLHSLHTTIEMANYGHLTERDDAIAFPFGSIKTYWQLMSMLEATRAADAQRRRGLDASSHEAILLSFFNQKLSPRVRDGYVEMTVPSPWVAGGDSEAVDGHGRFWYVVGGDNPHARPSGRLLWDWNNGGDWVGFPVFRNRMNSKELATIDIRASLAGSVFWSSPWWIELADNARHLLGISVEEMHHLVKRGPEEDDWLSVACPTKSLTVALKGFGLDIRSREVVIA